MSRQKKDKTPKILKKINDMSDDEFMDFHKKFKAHSIVDMVVGWIIVIGGIVLIILVL